MNYQVRLSEPAIAMLLKIPDAATRRLVLERINLLGRDPERQGGFLKGRLSGYRKCRAAGRRYRILYRIDETTSTVIVTAIGARNPGEPDDIYRIANQLLQEGLLE